LRPAHRWRRHEFAEHSFRVQVGFEKSDSPLDISLSYGMILSDEGVNGDAGTTSMATAGDVQDFLNQFRTCVEFGSRVEFRQTPKNIQGLVTLNLTQAEAIRRVCSLQCSDYCCGPQPDIDEDGKEIWVFGCVENNIEVYIKLRLDPRKKRFARPVVRSFHPAEHLLDYPLK